jgi:hypothetical protein
MAKVYFRCSNPEGILLDQRSAAVRDLVEAREHAALVVQSLIKIPILQDWRGWSLHVSDDFDEEIFVVPFASLLGKLH